MKEKKYYLEEEELDHHMCLLFLPIPLLSRVGTIKACACGDIFVLRSTITQHSWTGRHKYWIKTDLVAFRSKISSL